MSDKDRVEEIRRLLARVAGAGVAWQETCGGCGIVAASRHLLRLLDRERDVAERLAAQVGEESQTGGDRRSWRAWAEGASRSCRPELWRDEGTAEIVARLTAERDAAVARADKAEDYSIALQRLIERTERGVALDVSAKTAPHHYEIAVRTQVALAALRKRIEVEWMTDPRRDWPSRQEAEADAVPSTEAAYDDDPWAGDPDRPPQCPICLGRHEGRCWP